MLADSGIDLNKNVKRLKRKDIDFALKRLKSEIHKLENEGASNF